MIIWQAFFREKVVNFWKVMERNGTSSWSGSVFTRKKSMVDTLRSWLLQGLLFLYWMIWLIWFLVSCSYHWAIKGYPTIWLNAINKLHPFLSHIIIIMCEGPSLMSWRHFDYRIYFTTPVRYTVYSGIRNICKHFSVSTLNYFLRLMIVMLLSSQQLLMSI